MFYKKNLPGWERALRVAGGTAMIVCGAWALKVLPIGYLIACTGVFTLITGFVGFCPACAMVGRKTL